MSTKTFYIERGQDKFYAWESLEAPAGKYGEGETEIQAIGSLCKRLAGEEKWNARIPHRVFSGETLKDETRSQAIERYHRDGGEEEAYIRSIFVDVSVDGHTERVLLSMCNICNAHQTPGEPSRHLHYCPFANK